MEKKFVVTMVEWFFAPDGKQYKAAWGGIGTAGKNVFVVGNGTHCVKVPINWVSCFVECAEKPDDCTEIWITEKGGYLPG